MLRRCFGQRRIAHVLLLAVALMVFGGAEALGQVTYNGNGNTGFGGVLGPGSFDISDDGTTVTLTFNKGGADFNDALVVYIDSESGGVASTSNFTDTGDRSRQAVSGYDGSNRSTVNFPAGFRPDFAISANVNSSDANFNNLFDLVENGSHTFVDVVNINPNSGVGNSTYTMTFDFSEINTSSGSGSFSFVATYLNEGNAFRSDEAIGDGITTGNPNPGTNPVTFDTYFQYSSGNEGGKAVTAQAGNWSNASTWANGNVPLEGDAITIDHDVTLDQDATVSSLGISSGQTFTASDGSNGYTLTLTNGGALTNNGTFDASDGTIAAVGSGTVSVPGGITLNDVTVSTDDGTVTGLNFGSNNATVNGNLRIEEGGFVDTNPPEYGSSSTLVYDAAGTTYGRTTEWSASSGAGYPNNVTVQNNTTLDLSGGGAQAMAGNLTVESTSGLDMNDMGDPLTVGGSVTVKGTFILGSNPGGDLDVEGTSVTVDGGTVQLQGSILNLDAGSNTSLDETNGGLVEGGGPDVGSDVGGTIVATRTVNNPSSGVNVAGLGAVINTSADLGDVTVTRGHAVQENGGSNQSIERYYDINPGQNNSGLNADLTFNYDSSELNGISESNLTFFKSDDGGSTWAEAGFTTRGSNQVTLQGIESFSRWTLGSSNNPLPVELASFEARKSGQGAVLSWTTASETNNSGFVVQHAAGEQSFEKVGWVDGAGTTTEKQAYRFSMEDLSAGTHRFRLKQKDVDGAEHVTEPTTLTVSPDGAVAVQAAPNPVRHTSQVRVTTSETEAVTVALYDVLGRRVETLHEGRVAAEKAESFTVEASSLAAGMYFLRVQGESFTETKRITVTQ